MPVTFKWTSSEVSFSNPTKKHVYKERKLKSYLFKTRKRQNFSNKTIRLRKDRRRFWQRIVFTSLKRCIGRHIFGAAPLNVGRKCFAWQLEFKLITYIICIEGLCMFFFAEVEWRNFVATDSGRFSCNWYWKFVAFPTLLVVEENYYSQFSQIFMTIYDGNLIYRVIV